MKKESKFSKLYRRDEILRNNISIAGFVAFSTSVIFGSIEILTALISNQTTFIEAKSGLTMIRTSLLVFLGALFMLTIAKKEHFNKRSALLVTFIASTYFAISLYMQGLGPWWFFLFGWALLTWITYKVVKFIFEDISKSFFKN